MPNFTSLLELCNCAECPLQKAPVFGEGTNDKVVKVKAVRDLPYYGVHATVIQDKLDRDETATYPIAFVAISPAAEEMRTGRPMVGWSGTMLRKLLAKLGITNYYLTNSMQCHYEEGTTPAEIQQAVKCCSPRLFAELKAVECKLVVALGGTALEVLTGESYKITEEAGRVIPGIVCPVVPVMHPAALARRPDEYYDVLDGLKAAKRWMNGTYKQIGVPNVVVATEETIDSILDIIEKAEYVAVDLETTKTGFFPYDRDPDLIRCMVLSVDEETTYIIPGFASPFFEPHVNLVLYPRLMELLPKKKLRTHNGPFDLGFLLCAGYKDVKMYSDTFLAHHFVDERKYSNGLKVMGKRDLGAPDWEAGARAFLPNKKSSYDLIPDEALYRYAAYDGVCTYALGEIYEPKMASKPIYWDLIMPCANMFTQIRHRGVLVDVGYLMELDDVLEKELDKAEEDLSELIGHSINPFSSKEVAELLYDELGFPEVPKMGRGTGKTVLPLLGGPICDGILDCRAIGKLKSTYVVGMANFVDNDFRIHPFTDLTGAVTGRISTEDPSVMNITKKRGSVIKRLYVAPKGKLIAEMDAKQMELRCYSILGPDPFLRSILLSESKNKLESDPHMMVAYELTKNLGIDWETLTDKDRANWRQKSKNGVFGRLYGRGIESFIRGYGLTPEGAQLLVDAINKLFPSIGAYNEKVKWEIHNHGYLDSYFGRRRHFGLITDDTKAECYRQGANFKVQSMGSDVNLFCMLYIYEHKKELGVEPLFPVHDSIVMEIESEQCLPAVVKMWETHASEITGGLMKFKAEVAVGPNWGETVEWKG